MEVHGCVPGMRDDYFVRNAARRGAHTKSETRAAYAMAEDTQRHRMQAELSISPVQEGLTEILDQGRQREIREIRYYFQ